MVLAYWKLYSSIQYKERERERNECLNISLYNFKNKSHAHSGNEQFHGCKR